MAQLRRSAPEGDKAVAGQKAQPTRQETSETKGKTPKGPPRGSQVFIVAVWGYRVKALTCIRMRNVFCQHTGYHGCPLELAAVLSACIGIVVCSSVSREHLFL